MVNKCCVRGCQSRAGQNIKFHRFPKGDIGNQWVTFLKQHNPSFEKHVSSNVCGLHFDCNLDYEISSTSVFNTKTLKKNAVPSVINNTTTRKTLSNDSNIVFDEEEIIPLSLVSNLYSKPLETPMSTPSISDMTSQNANVASSQSVSPSTNIVEEQCSPVPQITNKKFYGKRKRFLGDFKSPNDLINPNNRLIYWYASQTAVTKQKKRVKYLQNQALNLKKQINALEKKADHLKTKNKLIMDVLRGSLSNNEDDMIWNQ
ncbi:Zinc finger, C2CH-type [Cinara cedri]|uniref:Zinc finger, C2CH-type n=1 Tax=Cinara cedri TaxID=506608 RepID=A0A5E4M0W6_9HEMI|nr:Zinc finger, C2CH-type [Cinara cedri]